MQTVVFRFLITVFPLIWSNFSRAFPFLRILKKYSSFLSCTIYNVTTCQYKLEPCGSGLVSCLHGVPIKPTNFYVACPEYQLTSEVFRTESTPLRPQNDTIIWDSLVGIWPQFETGHFSVAETHSGNVKKPTPFAVVGNCSTPLPISTSEIIDTSLPSLYVAGRCFAYNSKNRGREPFSSTFKNSMAFLHYCFVHRSLV